MAVARVVIVGAGHGGFQIAASLRQNGFDGAVVLIGDEPHLPYQRPPLSKDYLDGKIGFDLLQMRPEAFFADQRIELVMGVGVTAIDRSAKSVSLSDGKRVPYDHLVLATGARNRVPPLPGIELDGVCYLRDLAETDALKERLGSCRSAVIIGAGFIGLEFAAIARGKGVPVHIVELVDRVMARVVCPDTSAHFGREHQKTGVEFSFGARIERIGGEGGKVSHVTLGDGRTLPADLVLISIGVVANESLAAAAGLAVENGISVDEQLLTADPHISAIGDCASFPSRHSQRNPVRLEAVQNAADHARCVVNRLVGKPHAYEALPWFWSEQGALRLQIAGLTTGFQQVVLRGDYEKGEYSAFCYAGDKLLGIESINRPADHAFARRLLAASRGVSPAEAADLSFDLRAAAMARPAS
ncbi:MAG TPA: FAD-dependent oxidoreductase [Stellaceae bacterium]|jgi:3-phenylpropionate/trans-cinnamate dioxygenase ferredoxin reductase subunit|nr:FAD-dependent oxidoreductase [Stellaceae bacterium]